MTTKNVIVPYTGEVLKKRVTIAKRKYKLAEDNKIEVETTALEETIDPYLPDSTLMEAVELMQILERPLLLRGEPGCGKTRVAQAYAYERYKEDYRRYYYEWHIKSTSRAQDGLYTFDHIARLRNANGKGADEKAAEDLKQYIELGPLGMAFMASEPGKPAILLIDEIDKADIDFPNDLLLELDEMRFVIRETGEEIKPKARPLIFITSNQERELPQAFLRRCLFHFIQFPAPSLLEEIMLSNFSEFGDDKGKTYMASAIQRFSTLREALKSNPTANKNVTTSELKDWVGILAHFYKLNNEDPRISMDEDKLPFHTALLKTENDLKSMGKF